MPLPKVRSIDTFGHKNGDLETTKYMMNLRNETPPATTAPPSISDILNHRRSRSSDLSGSATMMALFSKCDEICDASVMTGPASGVEDDTKLVSCEPSFRSGASQRVKLRQMMLDANTGQGIVEGQLGVPLKNNSLFSKSHYQLSSQQTTTYGNTNGGNFFKSHSCNNYASSTRSEGVSSVYSQDTYNEEWPEFRGNSSSRGSGGRDNDSGRSLRHNTTSLNGESSRHGVTIKANNIIRNNDAGGSSGEKLLGISNSDSRDPDLDLQSDNNNSNGEVCCDHHPRHYRRSSMPNIGANQVNKHKSCQDQQQLNNSINSTSKFMTEFIELKMEVAQLRSELQVAQSNVTAQQKSMQVKNNELAKHNAALKAENQFYLKLLSGNNLEQQQFERKLEGVMENNDDINELLQLQSLLCSDKKENQSTTTTSSEALRNDHSWKKPELDWGSIQGGGDNDRMALVSTKQNDGNSEGEQQQQQQRRQPAKTKRKNSWWSMRRSSSLDEDILLEANNNNSNARSNDSQDSENRGRHENDTVLPFGAASTANTNDDNIATDVSFATRVGSRGSSGHVIELPLNDNTAAAATIRTRRQSSLENDDGNGELKQSSSRSFFDMDDDQQQHQQTKPSSWTSSWIRRTSDGETSSSGPARELQQQQMQHQRRNSFVETIKSIPRTLSMPRIIHEASVEEGVAKAETTDGEYHVEPRQLNLQRRPSIRQQHGPLRHPQQLRDGEGNGISKGNDEIKKVPEVVLFLNNGEGDLRCSDITHDAKGMESILAKRQNNVATMTTTK